MLAKKPSRLRVLVVDDHPGIIKSLTRLLSIDYDVVGTRSDAIELSETVAQLQPDVVVLDVNLPKVDGLTACRLVMQKFPALKVIVFTAVEDPDLRQRAFAAGAVAFVHKLGSVEDLLAVMKRLV